MKVSVLAFDLSDNATGRADLLARLLAPRYDVEVVGPRSGDDLWRPARGGAVRYRALPGARWPRLAGVLPALARLADGDVLLASKPRPTSFGVALLARRQRRRPLILDVDDWELGFFYRAGFWGRLGRLLSRHELHLSDEQRIAAVFTDCDRGAVPPVGMAWGIDTVVDEQLEGHDPVYLEGGDHQRLLRMSRDQFCALYEKRRPEYAKAAVCVQTAGKEIGVIAEEIISTLKLKMGVAD